MSQRAVDYSLVRRQAIGSAADISLNATIISITSTGAAYTITLKTAALLAGKFYMIKDQGGAANTDNITIATEGSAQIDGGATKAISVDGTTIWLYSDLTNWFSMVPTAPT